MARVLVVDDEPGVLLPLRQVLKKAGHSVTTAESLDAAVAAFSLEPAHLVLVDKNLPGATGFDVIERLRRVDPELPAILMTAYPEPLLGAKIKLQGYLPKPMDPISIITDSVNRALSFGRRSGTRDTPPQVPAVPARKGE
ncbi:MAG: response regulator [Deltaproteobacteria bacterium]|nr:response regulator [Deltaproteobacteria bacterium]